MYNSKYITRRIFRVEIRRCIIPTLVHTALRLRDRFRVDRKFFAILSVTRKRHVNDILVAFYITRRLNANEHNEPRVRSVGRSAKFRTDIALNWIWRVSLTSPRRANSARFKCTRVTSGAFERRAKWRVMTRKSARIYSSHDWQKRDR